MLRKNRTFHEKNCDIHEQTIFRNIVSLFKLRENYGINSHSHIVYIYTFFDKKFKYFISFFPRALHCILLNVFISSVHLLFILFVWPFYFNFLCCVIYLPICLSDCLFICSFIHLSIHSDLIWPILVASSGQTNITFGHYIVNKCKFISIEHMKFSA